MAVTGPQMSGFFFALAPWSSTRGPLAMPGDIFGPHDRVRGGGMSASCIDGEVRDTAKHPVMESAGRSKVVSGNEVGNLRVEAQDADAADSW